MTSLRLGPDRWTPRRTRRRAWLDRCEIALAVFAGAAGCRSEIVPDAGETEASSTASTGPAPATAGPVSSATSADATGDRGDTTQSLGSTDEGLVATSDSTGAGCRGEEDCPDPSAPFCERGSCVPCSDVPASHEACAAMDARTPACIEGLCAACPNAGSLCPAPAPACPCQPCTDHAQCRGDSGCDLLAGDCLPADSVFWVSDAGSCPGDGSQAVPFCAIQDAVDAIAPAMAGTVHIGPSAGIGYGQDVLLDGGRTIALLGPALGPAVLTPAVGGASSILTVAGANTTVYLERLRVRTSADGPAIAIEAATLHGDRVEVVQNSGGAIAASGGADLHLVNAMVGSTYIDATAISLSDSNASIAASTIIGGLLASAVLCTEAAAIDIRGSILLSSTTSAFPEVDCPGAAISGSATEAESGGFGFTSTWFQNLSGGDLHLTETGDAVFAGLGVWQDGDPLTDIDGDARAGVAGAPDYPGVDVPQP